MIRLEGATGQRVSCGCLMIVRDEERTIGACLNSVLLSGCFDQVVIVQDTRMSDRTAEILEGYARQNPELNLLWYKWKRQNYADARNRALREASTKYGLWLDGNEILLDHRGIYNLLGSPQGRGFHLWNLSPDPYGGIVTTHQLRLFPILTGVKWELPVHEQIAFSSRRAGVPEVMTPYRIWHLGYTSEAGNTRKHSQYAAIAREWLAKHPERNEKRAYMLEQYQNSMSYLRYI